MVYSSQICYTTPNFIEEMRKGVKFNTWYIFELLSLNLIQETDTD